MEISLDQARKNWSVPSAQEPLPTTTDRSDCDLTYHIKCENATLKDFKLIQRIVPMIWKCPICLHDISFDRNELPFASLSEESFNSMMRTDPLYNEFSQCDSGSDHLPEFAHEINTLPKDSSDESDLALIGLLRTSIHITREIWKLVT